MPSVCPSALHPLCRCPRGVVLRVLRVLPKSHHRGPQPRNARQPSPVRSRRLCGRRRLAHTGTLALQQAQSDGATQRRVACSSLADHTARPPLTVGISAVLGRRLPTDGKLARVLQCTRAASAQCCPASAAHDSTSPASTGPKELLCSPNYGAPAALDEQRRAPSPRTV